MKNMKFNQIKEKMEKYIIIEESLGAMSIVYKLNDREDAKFIAESLNYRAKARGSAARYYVYELTKD